MRPEHEVTVIRISLGIAIWRRLWNSDQVRTIRPIAAVPERFLISYIDQLNQMKNNATPTFGVHTLI